MSNDIFAREYVARIAPLDELRVRYEGRLVRESYAEHAFRSKADSRVPVIVNHDERLHVGYVDQVYAARGWHHAAFRLDPELPGADVAAEYIKRGTAVSIEGVSPRPLIHRDSVRHVYVRLESLSVLGAGVKPGYPGAEIVRVSSALRRAAAPAVSPSPRSPAAVPSSDRAVVGDDLEVPRAWLELERLTGVSINEHNFEAELVRYQRTELEKVYDDHMAAKRQTEPQVITRYGIGQVLAVGGVPVR